jgi:trimeric autotransporter adhesin
MKLANKITALALFTACSSALMSQQLLKDIYPGGQSSYPDAFTNVNGSLFFVARTPNENYELWKTDGTEPGTVLVKDIYPGNMWSDIRNMKAVNSTLFFTADEGVNDNELWKSDGTSAGTYMIKDIRPTYGSDPSYLCDVNGTLFFSANDGVNGTELWKSDGTSAGTIMVKDISPGFSSGAPEHLININGTLFFTAYDNTNGRELWKSDGTAAGTVLIKNFNNTSSNSFFSYSHGFTAFNNELFFIMKGASFYQTALWRSDGTAAGTTMVMDFSSANQDLKYLTVSNGFLYFVAKDNTSGEELWKTDGTPGGTVLVMDVNPGTANSYPKELININNTLFFTATTNANGYELWKTNSSGTTMVKDIVPGTGSTSISDLFNFNGTLLFLANDGNGTETWTSDGTSSGTAQTWAGSITYILDRVAGVYITPATAVVNGKLYFAALGAGGDELWTFDPAAIGITELRKDSRLQVYPNPANDKVMIKVTKEMLGSNYIVADCFGRLMLQGLVSSETTSLNLSSLAPGTYIVKISGKEVQTSTPIIKE